MRYSYTPLRGFWGAGQETVDARTTNSVTKSTILQNNLEGSPSTLTYPSGRVITYTLAYSGSNTAGRMASAVDSTGPINYASAALYAPPGGLSSLTNGASIVSTSYYNDRLQPCRISVKSSGTAPASCADTATGNVLDFSYNFSLGASDNGNVTAIANNRDNTRSQNFTYDALNRITSAQTQTTGVTIPNANCWGLTFGYDPWGNLLSSNSSGPTGCGEPLPLNVYATTANQMSTSATQLAGFCYDAAGNLLQQVTCPVTNATYAYDAENHMTSADGVTYTYDGDGRRVKKSSGKLYWYGTGSGPLNETDLFGNTNNSSFYEYVFFTGQRIARRDYNNNVDYYFSDHLGTSRVVTNSAGAILDDSDFYPFGVERPVLSSSGNTYKFTAKERDSESGLDNFGARYDSSSMGRFMSPEWSASPSPIPYASLPYPQSLNLYSYVQNNPLKSTDPTGHCTVDGEKHNWLWCAGHSLGVTETKKETAAREKNEAEVREFLRTHPQYLQNAILMAASLGTMMALEATNMGAGESDSTVSADEQTAIEAGAAGGAGAARTMVNGVPQPAAEGEIVVGPNGAAVRIPAGYVAEPAANGNGIVYRAAGSTGDANTIRIMGPDAQGRYPNGYVRIYNSSGQPVIPSTGKPGTQAQTHTPF
jgi:RHS repeat-associated protein